MHALHVGLESHTLAIGSTRPEPGSFFVGTKKKKLPLHPMTAFAWSGHIVALVSSTDLFTPWIKQIKRGFVWQSYFCCHGPVLKVKTFHEKFHFLTKYYQFKSPPAYAIPVLRELLSSMHHRGPISIPSFSARLHGFSDDLASTLQFTWR